MSVNTRASPPGFYPLDGKRLVQDRQLFVRHHVCWKSTAFQLRLKRPRLLKRQVGNHDAEEIALEVGAIRTGDGWNHDRRFFERFPVDGLIERNLQQAVIPFR